MNLLWTTESYRAQLLIENNNVKSYTIQVLSDSIVTKSKQETTILLIFIKGKM